MQRKPSEVYLASETDDEGRATRTTIMNRHRCSLAIRVGSILLFCALGTWISGQMLIEHAGRWTVGDRGGDLFSRVCKATEGLGLDFECVAANNGPWSMIKIPILIPLRTLSIGVHTVHMPVAFLALAYFVFMGVWFAFLGRPRVYGYRWHLVPVWVALCGTAVSLFYVGLMATGSAPWCVWCLVIHAINLLMVLAIWGLGASARRTASITTVSMSDWRPEQIAQATLTFREVRTVIAFSLILILGLWAYRREILSYRRELRSLMPYKQVVTSLQRDWGFLPREFYAQLQHGIPKHLGEPIDNDHPCLTVFTDFECPACNCDSLAVRNQIPEKLFDRMNLQIRHFPLSNLCNTNVDEKNHATACDAAYAAEAARLQGGEEVFWKMYDQLFKNSRRLSKEVYRVLAVRFGLDADRLLRDMESEAVRDIVQSDIELAKELGVTRTPVMFLNGRRIPKLCRVPVFWEAFAETWISLQQDRTAAGDVSSDSLAANNAATNGLQ